MHAAWCQYWTSEGLLEYKGCRPKQCNRTNERGHRPNNFNYATFTLAVVVGLLILLSFVEFGEFGGNTNIINNVRLLNKMTNRIKVSYRAIGLMETKNETI